MYVYVYIDSISTITYCRDFWYSRMLFYDQLLKS